ncbi:uncharacterized protein LOC131430751 [Malaya genurostris]|uniref:uncharacterized protein LOC131430751 n=1 Tax=Malaya genurostris TaxID=325434 RepID=UPI0026F3FBC9|nr:uncharacterized protein LOC131430751 [Malaya genurostris]
MTDTEQKTINYIETELVPAMVKRRVFKVVDGNDDDVELDAVKVTPLQPDGTFMLTVLFKAQVTVRSTKEATTTRIYQLAVKVSPSLPDDFYEACQFNTLFQNETVAYTEIIPTLGKAELYPKYYYSHWKSREAIMVLGDFTVDGWKMAPMVVNLPLEYCLLAVRELARFHGECYALKERKRALFDSIIGKFKESRYAVEIGNLSWLEALKTGPKRAVKALRESRFKDAVPGEYLQKLATVMEDIWSMQKRSVQPQEPLAIICHGDYLRNNIAFKYTDATDSEKPTHVMMFDFQTLRYASPMIDLVVFMANSTGYAVREKHFETIFRTYHSHLIQTLCSITETSPGDLPQHYSYDTFRKEYARYITYGFSIACSFLGILHEPQEDKFAMESMSTEEIIEDVMKRGGAALDNELSAMVYEMYELHKYYGIDPK